MIDILFAFNGDFLIVSNVPAGDGVFVLLLLPTTAKNETKNS